MRLLPFALAYPAIPMLSVAQLSTPIDGAVVLKRDAQAGTLMKQVLSSADPKISATTQTATLGTVTVRMDSTLNHSSVVLEKR
jgi:hypothetical protein